MPSNKRKTARKVFINDILNGTYIKRPGWEPSGILTRYGEVSRVNIMGFVVSVMEDENKSFLVDDGTGNILIRIFESEAIPNVSVGKLVRVVGRPREFNASKYIVPEIITEVDNKKWYKIHQIQIKLRKSTTPKLPVDTDDEKEKLETGPYQKVLNAIAVLDEGSGADIEDIINHINVDKCEKIIESLIEEGEIFEISPGRVKLLE